MMNFVYVAISCVLLLADDSPPFHTPVVDIDSSSCAMDQSSASSQDIALRSANNSSVLSNPVSYTVGNSPHALSCADFDHNGYLDLAIANYGGNTISILLNDGGVFGSETVYATGTPHSITTLDLNSDGYVDIASLNRDGGAVELFVNNHDSTFSHIGTYEVGEQPHSLCAALLNDDQYSDIAVVNHDEPATITTYFGTGMGTLSNRRDSFIHASGVHIAAADLNSGGGVDLIVSGFWDNSVEVLLNNGDGTFVEGTFYTVGALPWAAFPGDFDGDNDVDIATANFGSNTITCIYNLGNGSFGARSDFQTGQNPHSVVGADLDNDAHIDLITADWTDSTISVLLNDGDGIFVLEGQCVVGNTPVALITLDIDNDGDKDVMNANYYGQSVTALSNLSTPLLPFAINFRIMGNDSLHVVEQQPTFSWTYSGQGFNQTAFELQVGSDADWSEAEMLNSGPIVSNDSLLEYTGLPLIDGQTYQARIRLSDSITWGAWRQLPFRMNSVPSIPKVFAPHSDAVVTDLPVTLSIHNSLDMEFDSLYYIFEISPDSTMLFSHISTGTQAIDSITLVALDITLSEDTRYYWRVKASDYYEQSPYSEVESFIVNGVNSAPLAFDLISPANSFIPPLISVSPTLAWTDSYDTDPNDTVNYDLYLSIDSNFTFVSILPNIPVSQVTVANPLSRGIKYWWKIRAFDTYNLETWSSAAYGFRIMILGDSDGNLVVSISDAVYLINYIFAGGAAPNPLESGDVDCNGILTISDAVYLINYIFSGGPPPCEQ